MHTKKDGAKALNSAQLLFPNKRKAHHGGVAQQRRNLGQGQSVDRLAVHARDHVAHTRRASASRAAGAVDVGDGDAQARPQRQVEAEPGGRLMIRT